MRIPKMAFLRRLTFRLLLLGAGTVVGLVVAEILLTALGLPHFYHPRTTPNQFALLPLGGGRYTHVSIPSKAIRFTYDGDPRGYFDANCTVVHTTNAYGFRGPAFPVLPRDPNDFRIVFLGDSFTFGEGVRDDDTYVRKAQAILNASETPGLRHAMCYNFGVGGYNVRDCQILLERRLKPRTYECVVLKMDVSDMESRLYMSEEQEGSVKLVYNPRWYTSSPDLIEDHPPETVLYHSHLAQLTWKVVHGIRRDRAFLEYYRNLPETEAWQKGVKALKWIGDCCRKQHVPLYIVLFPVPPADCSDYPLQKEHDALKALAAEQGKVIDLVPLLASWEPSDTWVHPTDYHPNEKVHALVAEQVARALLDGGVLKKHAELTQR